MTNQMTLPEQSQLQKLTNNILELYEIKLMACSLIGDDASMASEWIDNIEFKLNRSRQ